jgi:hypothetical protein
MHYPKHILLVLLFVLAFPLYLTAGEHKLIIHISSSDPLTHAMALSQAESLKRSMATKSPLSLLPMARG